jgi:hypothetical protein
LAKFRFGRLERDKKNTPQKIFSGGQNLRKHLMFESERVLAGTAYVTQQVGSSKIKNDLIIRGVFPPSQKGQGKYCSISWEYAKVYFGSELYSSLYKIHVRIESSPEITVWKCLHTAILALEIAQQPIYAL